jgi:hypothetical protein
MSTVVTPELRYSLSFAHNREGDTPTARLLSGHAAIATDAKEF